MKIALVHDWITNFGGAEKLLLALTEVFPEAPIYTSVYNKEKCPEFSNKDIRVSFLQKIPGAKNHHQMLLPILPLAFESFDLAEFDAVVSITTSFAKGVITKPRTFHVCYCNSPTRYSWDDSVRYVKESGMVGGIKSLVVWPIISAIRVWDRAAAERPDSYISNSNFIAKRVKKYYGLDSKVIHPPVDVEQFSLGSHQGDYYFAFGRLVPYKKFDLLVKAAKKGGFKLVIAGEGPEFEKLTKNVPPNISFTGKVSHNELNQLLGHAKAMLFPQEEDFGIAPVEAMATGCPVIAYRAGGALDYVHENVSGLFFGEQTIESLLDAINRFENLKFDSQAVRLRALNFAKKFFCENMKSFIEKGYLLHKEQFDD